MSRDEEDNMGVIATREPEDGRRRKDADFLVGMTVAQATHCIEANEVYFGEMDHPVTEIRVCKRNGCNEQGSKDLRDHQGRMRLNVETEDGKIVKASHVS